MENNEQKIICPNCEHQFRGNFCSNCGQEAKEFDRPFGFVFYDFLGNFFSFDSRLFKSLKYLVFNPGKLSIDFFEGKRMSYTPPFRLFIFASFILFLLLQFFTSKTLDQNISDNLQVDSTVSFTFGANSIDTANQKMVKGLNDNIQLRGETEELDELISKSGSIRELMKQISYKLEDEMKLKYAENNNDEEKESYEELIQLLRSPEIFTSQVLKYTSWFSFLLLPVFALLLMLFYRKQKYNFIKHLIFSFHLHSFLFLVLSIIVGVKILFTGSWTNYFYLLIIVLMIYFLIACIRFYHQKWTRVSLKSVGIWLSYGLISMLAVTFVIARVAIQSIG